jgi:hypothetical protein
VQGLYDTLLVTIKNGPTLGQSERFAQLAPIIRRIFDLPLMTRLPVGPAWAASGRSSDATTVWVAIGRAIRTSSKRFASGARQRLLRRTLISGLSASARPLSRRTRYRGDSADVDLHVCGPDAEPICEVKVFGFGRGVPDAEMPAEKTKIKYDTPVITEVGRIDQIVAIIAAHKKAIFRRRRSSFPRKWLKSVGASAHRTAQLSRF